MTNGKMDAIQVNDAVVCEKRTLSPRFILLGERLVEAAYRTGTTAAFLIGDTIKVKLKGS